MPRFTEPNSQPSAVLFQKLAAVLKGKAAFSRGNQGEEKIEVVAETAGSYRLLVKTKYPNLPAGRYEIRLIEVRAATDTNVVKTLAKIKLEN